MAAAEYVNFKFYEIKGAINDAVDVSSTGFNNAAGSVSSGTTSAPGSTTDIAIGNISTGNTATYSSTTFTSGTGTLFTLNQNTGGAIVNQVSGYLILSSATGQAFSATSSANYYASACIILIKAKPVTGGTMGMMGVG
ncbi:MAG TPA: hypothetical protein VJC09_01550 [Candidatus Saccharimonadales bacterium]|nr:hypothetical protein [Candidatus Saccharimonadales bacterium]